VGVVQVAARENSLFFTNFGFCIDQFDSPATASSHWLQNVKCVRVLFAFSVELEGFVLFGETVTHRRDVELFGEFHSESINVAPKKVLSAQLGTVWEVVDLLILVHIFYVWRCDVAGPLQVVKLVIRLNHREASMLG
jgi:hypothetical protein